MGIGNEAAAHDGYDERERRIMGRYVIWQPEAGQDEAHGIKISARDARTAVEEWADRDDFASNEYHIVGGQPATVTVRDVDAGTAVEWIVSGESVRRYTAQLRHG